MTNQDNGVLSSILPHLIKSLSFAVFVYEDGILKSISPFPESLCEFLPRANRENTDVIITFEDMPFVENFLFDAQEHWEKQSAKALYSGPWVEQSESGIDVAFEAAAIWIEGQNILLVEDLQEKHSENSARLQFARDHLLYEERLEREVQKRTQLILEREQEVSHRLLIAASFRDQETGAHIRRIGLYCAAMASHLGWPQELIDQIRIAAPMHDIGKIGLPDCILKNAGSLNDEEVKIMHQHPSIGAKMLAGTGIGVMDMASDIAKYHHEKWDGTGYPYGLKGQQIPLAARITAIVDIYDALVHERVYKPAFDEAKSLGILEEMAGSHIDPDLHQAFLQILPEIRAIKEAYKDEESDLLLP